MGMSPQGRCTLAETGVYDSNESEGEKGKGAYLGPWGFFSGEKESPRPLGLGEATQQSLGLGRWPV